MVKCGIRQEGTGFTVIVHNEQTGYRFIGETYEPKRSGPFAPSAAEYQAAKDKALADARDWAAKFKGARIKAEVVEAMS